MTIEKNLAAGLLLVLLVAVSGCNSAKAEKQTDFKGQSAGFISLKPTSWFFEGAGKEGSTVAATKAEVTFKNLLDTDLILGVSGNRETSDLIIKFVKSGSTCGWYGTVEAKDENGNNVELKKQTGYTGYPLANKKVEFNTVTIPAGKSVTVTGILSATAGGNCGGGSGEEYRFTVGYPTLLDQAGVQHRDSGRISDKFQ